MARVLFIQNFWFEYLGVMILSSVLKDAGHEVDLIIENRLDDIESHVAGFKPDIVGAYVSSGSHQWIFETMAALKRKYDIFTIIGGPHPTYYPDTINIEGIDAICIGEGEGALLDLCQCMDNGRTIKAIENLWIKEGGNVYKNPLRPLIQDLDALPYPDRELYYKYDIIRDSPSKHFITGRGCPFSCAFCCNKAYKDIYRGLGMMVRRASPESVTTEILKVKEIYPLKSVRFDDEVFLIESTWTLDFLNRYRATVNLPFSCLIRADLADETMIRAMKEAGCYTAYFGIESGSETLRNKILRKNVSRDQIIETARLLRKYRIKIGTFNMVGMPGETFEDAWETVRLNQIIGSDYPWCSIIQPYPGTELEIEAKRSGHLDPDYGVNELRQSYFNDTVIENRDSESLVALQKLFYIAVKFPSLSRIIRWLARNGGNRIWAKWIFNLTYAYRYSKTYRMPLIKLIKRAMLWKDNY